MTDVRRVDPVSPRPAARRRGFALRRALVLVGGGAPLVVGAGACLDRNVGTQAPRTNNAFAEQVRNTAVDKIDLLFMIDNSSSMADKQEVLSQAVPALLDRLINPACVDAKGARTGKSSVAGEGCDLRPEFQAIRDIHVGIVSSSLGGHGSDQCTSAQGKRENDQAHLLGDAGGMATGQESTYLNWAPGSAPAAQVATLSATLETSFKNRVVAVGQNGCGYECQQEAWYRFLVDPSPPVTTGIENAAKGDLSLGGAPRVTFTDIDETLLKQRAEFLRPDSLVAIVELSDENDSCVVDGQWPVGVRLKGQAQPVRWTDTDYLKSFHVDPQQIGAGGVPSYFLAQGNRPMNKGTAACEDFPYGPDCQIVQDMQYTADDDVPDVRFWEPKRRFGVTTQYPMQRYIEAITRDTVIDTSGATLATPKSDDYVVADGNGNKIPIGVEVTNPLFDDLLWNAEEEAIKNDPSKKHSRARLPSRERGLVFLAGIVGVPWQDIARGKDPTKPVSSSNPPDLRSGYKTAREIRDDANYGWDWILGDPYAAELAKRRAKDPLMVEDVADRTTKLTNLALITGETLGSAGTWNSINGHDWLSGKSDLQYACIFPLQTEKTCAVGNSQGSCDCGAGNASTKQSTESTRKNPLCESYSDPKTKVGTGTFSNQQARAKAYPGTRELEVLKGVQDQGIVASICPANLDPSQASAADYGYNPAVAAIIDRLKQQLAGRCVPRQLELNPDGSTPCLIVAATQPVQSDGTPSASPDACDCTGDSLQPIPSDIEAALTGDVKDKFGCRCQLKQLTGSELTTCQTDAAQSSASIHGWCYVDPNVPGIDDATKNAETALVKGCAGGHTIQFYNTLADTKNKTLFITCLGAATGAASGASTDGSTSSSGGTGPLEYTLGPSS